MYFVTKSIFSEKRIEDDDSDGDEESSTNYERGRSSSSSSTSDEETENDDDGDEKKGSTNNSRTKNGSSSGKKRPKGNQKGKNGAKVRFPQWSSAEDDWVVSMRISWDLRLPSAMAWRAERQKAGLGMCAVDYLLDSAPPFIQHRTRGGLIQRMWLLRDRIHQGEAAAREREREKEREKQEKKNVLLQQQCFGRIEPQPKRIKLSA